jgi:hypothetical protein
MAIFDAMAVSRGVGVIVGEERVVVVDTTVPGVPLVAVVVGGGSVLAVMAEALCLLDACNRADALLEAAGLGRVAVGLLGPGFDAVVCLVVWLPLILDALLTVFQYLTM